jgi:hypothetical protein
VEQEKILVDVYTRDESGNFNFTPLEIRGLDDSFELPALEIYLSMSEIYKDIDYRDDAKNQADSALPTPSPWKRG